MWQGETARGNRRSSSAESDLREGVDSGPTTRIEALIFHFHFRNARLLSTLLIASRGLHRQPNDRYNADANDKACCVGESKSYRIFIELST
jgi:hypothetical protein